MALQKKNIYKPVIKRIVLIIFLFVVSNKLQSQNNHQYLTKRPYAVVLGRHKMVDILIQVAKNNAVKVHGYQIA